MIVKSHLIIVGKSELMKKREEIEVTNTLKRNILTGCGLVILIPVLLVTVFVLTMCQVPKEKYEPYISFGQTYYEAVLGVNPKITHGSYYMDEGGGFNVSINFTKDQLKKPSVKLYLKNVTNEKYTFRGSSTESQVVDISEDEKINEQKMQVYSELNEPIDELFCELFYDGATAVTPTTESEYLNFWKEFVENYELLSNKSLDERLEWLKSKSD
ncbi:hypothetical protein D929_02743 [Enterococcus faecalis 02-MB-P-10]|nr:hypothetical protein D929_02743 [Enterococcus faecalis 02-MB-P-10]